MGTNAFKVKNHINIQPGAAPASPVYGDIYCDVSGVFRRWNGTIWEVLGAGGGSGTSVDVSQTAHGFVAADIGKAIRSSGVSGQYTFAMADAANNAEVVGIISDAASGVPNQFSYIAIGPMTGLSGLTTGEVYFLSASASGVATTTEPSVVGQISKPLYVATSPTTAIILNSRGTTVGGTNLSTTIGLTLATSTVIQNVSAWPNGGGGKINGTITVLGPSPIQGCRVEINFQKLSSTVYNISEAFPSSSIIAASGALSASVNETNGDISITLPTITSATSASITFSIDASSVGTTLPLQIDSNKITWDVTALSNDSATQLGLKQYLHGTNYNGGNAPTVSSALGGFAVTRAVFVPYKSQGGEWRLRFNIASTCTSAARTLAQLSINGVLFKNIAGFIQPCSQTSNGGYASLLGGECIPNTSTVQVAHASDTISRYTFSGDVELDSKPTWAY